MRCQYEGVWDTQHVDINWVAQKGKIRPNPVVFLPRSLPCLDDGINLGNMASGSLGKIARSEKWALGGAIEPRVQPPLC
jgi:hypothetical protein